LRDEVKRLRATELAVVDDPTAKQRVVQGKAGAYAGAKQYGEAANLPRGSSRRGGNNTPSSKVHKPGLDEMGIATWHEVKPDRGKRAGPRKPTLDEMGPGTESKIYRVDAERAAAAFRRQARRRVTCAGQREQDHPADQLAGVGAGVRAGAEIERRGAGASGRVEEEVMAAQTLLA
jgi:hypothetical protein